MIVPEKVLDYLLLNYHAKGGNKVLITDDDYNNFSEDVANRTGTKAYHCNTWKRVFRHLKKKDNSPYESSKETCHTIALYLGYETWEELIEDLDNDYERFLRRMGNNNASGIQPMTPVDIMLKNLKKGDKVEVKYVPERILLLEFINKDRYKVIGSKNSSLMQGDIVYISMFAIGYPLMVSELIRDGVSKGIYQSAHGHNIQSIDVHKNNDLF